MCLCVCVCVHVRLRVLVGVHAPACASLRVCARARVVRRACCARACVSCSVAVRAVRLLAITLPAYRRGGR